VQFSEAGRHLSVPQRSRAGSLMQCTVVQGQLKAWARLWVPHISRASLAAQLAAAARLCQENVPFYSGMELRWNRRSKWSRQLVETERQKRTMKSAAEAAAAPAPARGMVDARSPLE
jgi:hypothetical protein